MEKNVADIIQSYSDCEIHEDYSGRGMYGNKTTGIVFEDEQEFFNAISEIMVSGDDEEREDVSDWLFNVKRDSMGLGVIYY